MTNINVLQSLAECSGYRTVPSVGSTLKGYVYANGQTYGASDPGWQRASCVAMCLDEAVLVDYDGYKQDDAPSLQELATMLGISHGQLMAAAFQVNDMCDSVHFLFRKPAGVKLKDSADGKLHDLVDIKTGNQIVNLKPNKILYDGWIPTVETLQPIPAVVVDLLRHKEYKSDCDVNLAVATSERGWRLLNRKAEEVREAAECRDVTLRDALAAVYCNVAGGGITKEDADRVMKEAVNSNPSMAVDSDYQKWIRDIDSALDRFGMKNPSDYCLEPDPAVVFGSGVSEEAMPTYHPLTDEIAESIKASFVNTLVKFWFNPEHTDELQIVVDRKSISAVMNNILYMPSNSHYAGFNRNEQWIDIPDTLFKYNIEKFLDHNRLEPVLKYNNEYLQEFIASMNLTDARLDKLNNALVAIVPDALKKPIQHNNQFNKSHFEVDMFAKSAYIESIKDNMAVVKLTHKPFLPDVKHKVHDPKIIADFKQHFPEFDELLDMIVAGRFAADRKKCYVWLQATSDFGKGLLASCFQSLGLTVTLQSEEVKAIMAGKPIAKDYHMFLRAWISHFDEFERINSSMKMLESDMQLSPKNQMNQTVKLYTKFFTSKDDVDSLAGSNGVESQFANRFSYIHGEGSIQDRFLFTENTLRYVWALETYIATRIDAAVEQYLSLGYEGAANKANGQIDAFRSKYNIADQLGGQDFDDIALNFVSWCMNQYSEGLLPTSKVDHIGKKMVCRDDGEFFIMDQNNVFNHFMSVSNRSDIGGLKSSRPEILEAVAVNGKVRNSHRVYRGSQNVKAIRVKSDLVAMVKERSDSTKTLQLVQ